MYVLARTSTAFFSLTAKVLRAEFNSVPIAVIKCLQTCCHHSQINTRSDDLDLAEAVGVASHYGHFDGQIAQLRGAYPGGRVKQSFSISSNGPCTADASMPGRCFLRVCVREACTHTGQCLGHKTRGAFSADQVRHPELQRIHEFERRTSRLCRL